MTMSDISSQVSEGHKKGIRTIAKSSKKQIVSVFRLIAAHLVAHFGS